MDIQTLLTSILVMFIAEIGDKTQLMTVTLASKYKLRPVITGIIFAILLLNILAVWLGSALSGMLPMDSIHLLSAFAFLGFALWAIYGDNAKNSASCTFFFRSLPTVCVFLVFFVSEVGDKTQLWVLSAAAAQPDGAVSIFIGASLGFIAANAVGLAVGLYLGKNLPAQLLKWVSYGMFSAFGLWAMHSALPRFLVGYQNEHILFIALMFLGLTGLVEYMAQQNSAISQRV